jgi:hypothetical protein
MFYSLKDDDQRAAMIILWYAHQDMGKMKYDHWVTVMPTSIV